MKTVMKLWIVLVVLAIVTSVATAAVGDYIGEMYWDGEASPDNSWGIGLNWDASLLSIITVAEEGHTIAEVGQWYDEDDEELESGLIGDPESGDYYVLITPAQYIIDVPQVTIPYAADTAPDADTRVDLAAASAIQLDVGAGVAGVAKQLYIGKQSAGAVTVTVDGGSLAVGGKILMGEKTGDVANLDLVSGTITTQSHILVGNGSGNMEGDKASDPDSGGIATFTTAAGTTVNIENGSDLEVTYYGGTTGIVTVAGTINISDDLRVAGNDHQKEGTAVGLLTMNGDAVITVGDVAEVGRYGTGTLELNNDSSLSIKNDLRIGQQVGGVGVVTVNDDSSIVIYNDDLKLAEDGGTATLNINDNATVSVTRSGKDMYLSDDSDDSVSNLNITGGKLYVDDNIRGAYDGKGTVNINISGGEIDADDLVISRRGTGFLNVSGTALLNLSDDLEFAQYSGTSTMTMSGGTVNIGDDFEMSKGGSGNDGVSIFTMTAGEININDDMKFAQNGGTAIVHVLGGTINVGDSLRLPHEAQSGTTSHLTLGDNSNPWIAFGAATISCDDLNMNGASAEGVDSWIEFQLGGLLVIAGEFQNSDPENLVTWVTYVQDKIDEGYITFDQDFFDTFAGSLLGADESIGIVVDFDGTDTSVSLGVVPEPATMLLLGIGGLVLRRKRRVS